MIKVILKRGRDSSLRRFHPWVFSGAVATVQGTPAEGDIVAVYSAEGEYLAAGHYQVGSIAVRILSFDEEPTSPDFWKNSLSKAVAMRRSVGLDCFAESSGTNCFRLVHGEGDGLPGLIVDWYDGVCVLQAHSAGMFRAKSQICAALKEVFGDALKAVYDKSSATAPFKAGLELVDGYLYRSPAPSQSSETVVEENGRKFIVNWEEGQKTGFFLDQRDNRVLVGRYAAGRRVLNLFCYTGGFSVYALTGGAEHVDSVDSSAKAIALADRNLALNGCGKSAWSNHCADAMEFLSGTEEGKYDMMIVDPPAFAKHRDALKNALRAYQRLNAAAIAKVAPGGLVFTFSCSQVVDKITFANTVFSAAAQTGRRVRIIDRFCQGADHPVSIYHPEGEYLKGLLLYVE